MLAPLVLCLSLACAPQTSARGIFGRVLRADGSPWTGATVVLAARAGSTAEEAEPTSTTTDDRGRFKLTVPPAGGHVVWAHGAPDEAGVARVTGAWSLRPIDRRIELAEAARVPVVRLHLLGHERRRRDWCAEPRLVLLGRLGLATVLRPDEDGVVTLPVWPAQDVEVQCRDVDGLVLLRHEFPTGLDERRERVEDLAARRRQFVELPLPEGMAERMPELGLEPFHCPPKARLRLQVVTAEDGTPIAGARLLEHPGSAFHGVVRSLVTDADGRATLEVPWRLWPWGRPVDACIYEWLVRVDGREDRIAYWELRPHGKGSPHDLDELLAGKPVELRCAMEAEVPVRGTVLLPPGADPTKVSLAVACTGPLSRSDDWIAYVRQPVRNPRPDAEGRFVLHGLGSDPEGLRVRVGLDEALWRALGSRRTEVPGPPFLERVVSGLEDLEKDHDLPLLDFAHMAVADLDLRLDNGRPASFAEVLAVPPQPEMRRHAEPWWKPLHLVADLRGRCRLPVPIEGLKLLVRTDEAWAVARLRVDDANLRQVAELVLQPIPRVSGRLVDAEGAPRAGVRLFGRALHEGAPVGGVGRAPRLFEQVGLELLEARTDADGGFDLPYLPIDGLTFVLVAYKPWSQELPQQNVTSLPPERPGEPLRVVLDDD